MEILKTFRHEYKYLISYEEMLNLRSKLNELLEIDRDYNAAINIKEEGIRILKEHYNLHIEE